MERKRIKEEIERIPLPIESGYFNDDVITAPNDDHFNRHYFKYPAEWLTSNLGEKLIGVRNIWLTPKPRLIRMFIFLRKYRKQDFYQAAIENFPEYDNMIYEDFIKLDIDDNRIQEIVNLMDGNDIIVHPFIINTHLLRGEDWMSLFNNIDAQISNQASNINADYFTLIHDDTMTREEKIEDLKAIYEAHKDDIYYNIANDIELFNEQNKNSLIGSLNRDFRMDEEYGPNSYNEILWSPRNTNPLDSFYVDILLTKLWGTSTYEKTYMKTNENEYSPYSRADPQPITDDDKFNDDVIKMFNIGEKPYKNSLSYLAKYHRRITIDLSDYD